ncbi:MAG: hypothetical protein JWM10_2441 [Myxococcaceae bacterium]|nr:hypothetical protein [Myxococcaceae bacterium]
MERPDSSSLLARAVRVAVFGGDARQERRFRHLGEVAFYPAAGCGGPHHAQRLLDSIRHGGVDRVFILARWNGHSASGRVRDVARRHGVPVTILAGVQAPRTTT